MKLIKYINMVVSLCLWSCGIGCYAAQTAWYVAFSGESSQPINTIYSLSVTDGAILGSVIPDAKTLGLKELRNMSVGPDGKLYVTNAYKKRLSCTHL